jgi:RNA polymerase sigma factor (sigma-70 family)
MSAELLDQQCVTGVTALLANAKPPADDVINGLATEDQVLLAKLLNEPADVVDHPDFDSPEIELRLFGGPARFATRQGTRFVDAPASVPPASSKERLIAISTQNEQLLFMRFNYARKQVADLLARFSGKPLTASATRSLLAWGHRILAVRSIIVRLNLPLVLAMAKRTRLSGVDFNEMVSEGNMALLRSVEKFDCSRGYKFSTYSCRAILKSFSRVAMRTSRYRGKFPAEFDPAMERSDFLDRKRVGVEVDCVDELKEILIRNSAGLSDVERTVIQERFAIGGASLLPSIPKTLEQVGQIIGVTKERVRQIQNNALRKIRHALEEGYLAA